VITEPRGQWRAWTKTERGPKNREIGREQKDSRPALPLFSKRKWSAGKRQALVSLIIRLQLHTLNDRKREQESSTHRDENYPWNCLHPCRQRKDPEISQNKSSQRLHHLLSSFIISKAAGKRKQSADTEAKESRRGSRGEEVVSASQSFTIVSIASNRAGTRLPPLALFQ